MRTSLKRALSNRARFAAGESGFAVPTVFMALVAAFGLGTATVIASIGAQTGTVRDQDTKQALAAAEAGIANAMLRFNRIATTSAADACRPVGGMAPGAGGWCSTPVTWPPVTSPVDPGTGGRYTYWVRYTPAAGPTPAQIKVVSTGTVDGVSRRVTATADTISKGYQPFGGGAGVIGLDSIFLHSGNPVGATIEGNVATNGNIGLSNGGTLDCDFAHANAFSPNDGNSTCSPTPEPVSLPPVNPGNVETTNSNSRICTLDPCKTATWSAATKRLSFQSGGGITLGAPGGEFNYALCKLTLGSNSYLHVAAGARVRIYLLAPDRCANEAQPLVLNSGSKIQPTGAGVADLAILIVGAPPPVTTSAIFNADSSLFDCNQAFVLYAPRTDVVFNSRTEICGGMAAKSIVLNGGTAIRASDVAQDFELPNEQVPSHYGEPHDFVDCRVQPTTASPDSGC